MSLETASYIANLQVTNPDGGDARSTADDHLRLIKAVLVRSFPKIDSAVSLSAAQVMYLNDLSASVQLQLNQLRDGSATANNALYANSASLATVATNSLALGGVAANDFARLSQSNVFTGTGDAATAAIKLSSTGPHLSWNETGAAANNRLWDIYAGSEQFIARAVNDAVNNAGTWLVVDRTGVVIDSIALSATTITLSGNVVGTITNAVNATAATNATFATNATNAATALTAVSASSAALLTGIAPSAAADASTVAVRTASGYLLASYFNQSSSNSENPVPSQVIVTNGSDDFFRKMSLAGLGPYLETINVTSKTGTKKTLASGVGPPSLSGSTNGDIFYYY